MARKSLVLQCKISSGIKNNIKARALIKMECHMFKKLKLIALSIYLIFSPSMVFAADIPIIVIAPGKTSQLLSTVGSSVTVITGDQISESADFSLANIIAENSTSTNSFQMGGLGTNTGIQLRGLEKRFSTVYVDGVKMLDPSSPDGSFYMENIMKNSIDRVEILKGTQSSLYGSNAIGGTIHIFTKKGKDGNHSDYQIETGSNNTKNLTYSINGADEKFDYYLGINKFITEGVSAMNDNDEDDGYRNDGLVGNLGYKINDNFRLENSFRYTDAFLEYDAVATSSADNFNTTDNTEGSVVLKLINEQDKFKNTFTFNKLYIERKATNASKAKSNYFGYRDALNYVGEYNFNLDNRIVYGIDSEFDASRYPRDYGAGSNTKRDENVISQYFDYQFRPIEKLYATIGLRSDDHSTAGREPSGRTTLAYKLDGNSKIRSSLGAGVRFPALYDYGYGSTHIVSQGGAWEDLKNERGISFDLGYDTYLDNLDLGLNVTYFKTKQKNSLLSNARTGWVMANATGVNTSEGVELSGNWKPSDKKFSLGFGYTFTDSYDAATCDELEQASYVDGECEHRGSLLSVAKVRVPRHSLFSKVDYKINPNFKTALKGKYVGERRDFGNGNQSRFNGYEDTILSDYYVFDLEASYNLYNSYKAIINIGNILDENYEEALQYSSMGRNINFGIKRVF